MLYLASSTLVSWLTESGWRGAGLEGANTAGGCKAIVFVVFKVKI
jgi:hypothetical protein